VLARQVLHHWSYAPQSGKETFKVRSERQIRRSQQPQEEQRAENSGPEALRQVRACWVLEMVEGERDEPA
jgi:hypothetical protein